MSTISLILAAERAALARLLAHVLAEASRIEAAGKETRR